MNKIDWKAKLSSRKFWAAIVAFATTILTALNVSHLTVEQITTIIGGVGSLCVYILGESIVDAARAKGTTNVTNVTSNSESGDQK